ncbi:transposase [Pseudomonas aeruginosa]|nr:transposase [Pseudomonas aeruginosa]
MQHGTHVIVVGLDVAHRGLDIRVVEQALREVDLPPGTIDIPGLRFEHRGKSMSTQRFTPEFKAEAVRQVIERRYSVAEIAARLGVSTHSLYKWVKAVTPDMSEK